MDAGPSTSVQHELEVRLVAAGRSPIPLAVTLTYDSTDPYAVHALFRTAQTASPQTASPQTPSPQVPDLAAGQSTDRTVDRAAAKPDTAAVEWVFARDTLADGVDRPTGHGDVRVWPCAPRDLGRDVVYLSLTSPDGRALLEAPAAELSAFLLRSYAAVPRGAETHHLDMDATLAALLES